VERKQIPTALDKLRLELLRRHSTSLRADLPKLGNERKRNIGNGVMFTIAWDWIYGWYQDHDVFYPFKDWFNSWGFQGTDAKPIPFKTGRIYRILFDIDRLLFAIFVYLI